MVLLYLMYIKKIVMEEKFVNDGALYMTVADFFKSYSGKCELLHNPCESEDLMTKTIPISELFSFVGNEVYREMLYCSNFRFIRLSRIDYGFYRVWNEPDKYAEEDMIFKSDTMMREVLYSIFLHVKQIHQGLLYGYNDYYHSDRCEYYVEDPLLSEFITRNADKYGIDYYFIDKDDTEVNIVSIDKEWI